MAVITDAAYQCQVQDFARYYITATDNLSRTVTAPGEHRNFYSFTVSTDITLTGYRYNSTWAMFQTLWPATVTATVTDNIGVDSSWVKWYKNNTGTESSNSNSPNTGGQSRCSI